MEVLKEASAFQNLDIIRKKCVLWSRSQQDFGRDHSELQGSAYVDMILI